MEIGAFVRGERLRLGMTQAVLAERIEMTSQSVSNLERGVSAPSIATLRKLARVFGRSLDELAGEDKTAA